MSKPISCDVVVPEAEDALHEGCPVLTKRRALLITKGQCGLAEWQMRWKSGEVADLSSCFADASLSESTSTDSVSESAASVSEPAPSALPIGVRFQGCDRTRNLASVVGTVVDASQGLVRFPLPEAVCQNSGLYHFQIAVLDGGRVVFADDGLLSVEHGMWGDTNNMSGPPTLEEIRFHLRDRAAENDLLAAVEFDNAEILEAVRHPVMYWNEQLPPLPPLNCNNFPFRHHWRNAIVAELLFVAAHHYVRNKMQSTSGGLNVDDKNKNQEYLALAMHYKQEWQQFVVMKKMSINASGFYGAAGSAYGNYNA